MDTTSSDIQHAPHGEETVNALAKAANPQGHKAKGASGKAKPASLWQRVKMFCSRLFKGNSRPITTPQKIALVQANEDRAATARAALMQPPMGFRGDTASTLVTPISAYAGKPVDQAIRKRAEQQFKNLDLTITTMN